MGKSCQGTKSVMFPHLPFQNDPFKTTPTECMMENDMRVHPGLPSVATAPPAAAACRSARLLAQGPGADRSAAGAGCTPSWPAGEIVREDAAVLVHRALRPRQVESADGLQGHRQLVAVHDDCQLVPVEELNIGKCHVILPAGEYIITDRWLKWVAALQMLDQHSSTREAAAVERYSATAAQG